MDKAKTRKRLEAERDRLRALRDGLLADPATGLADAGTDAVAAEERPTYDQAPGSLGSVTFEQEKNQSILEQVNEDLASAEDALARLDAGTYGVCLVCGQPIDPARLEALPFARYCLKDQAAAERPSGLPREIG